MTSKPTSPATAPAGTIGAAAGAGALAAHLAAAPSVTAGLLSWCEAHGIGEGPIRVLARSGGAPPASLAALLGRAASGASFRRVVLGRGGIALAEADNLFLAARLPAPMRATLAGTDEPFGSVVAPLGPVRRTLTLRTGAEAGPGVVLAQEAVLVASDGSVLAAVAERFLPVLIR